MAHVFIVDATVDGHRAALRRLPHAPHMARGATPCGVFAACAQTANMMIMNTKERMSRLGSRCLKRIGERW